MTDTEQVKLLFYDFEVFKYDWMCVIISPFENMVYEVVNDRRKLEQIYRDHIDDIWVGYNSRNYDQYILKSLLIIGMDPKKVSDYIISGHKGWEYSSTFNRIQLYNYDCMKQFNSLKQLEGFMGNSVLETSVPFDIDRRLTRDEIAVTMAYCRNDVEQTMEVFLRTKATFEANMELLRTFDLPLSNISKTQAQLTALALECARRKEYNDEWDIQFIDTLRLKKYKFVMDWFMDPQNHDYDKSLVVDIAGIPHTFAWGGIHGASDKPIHRKGMIVHVDVNSFYPSIMIRYDLLSRNVKHKESFKQIYDKRIQLKKEGKKAEQAPLKICLNSMYGVCKDKTSSAYDPRQATSVCVNGQLLLLDLIEHLEDHCELIQSNTDGLIVQIPDTDEAYGILDDICYEWEQRTGMTLEFDNIVEIWQKDVNNYIFRFEDGRIERKGAYVKPLNDLDNDLPIVNKALVDYMVNGIPVEQTINECDELKQFQKIYKISGKYVCGWHNYEDQNGETFRVFASNDPSDTHLGKVKNKNGIMTVEKFANSPEHCFIDNRDINGDPVPKKLDRQYYIDLAKKRLKDFGVTG